MFDVLLFLLVGGCVAAVSGGLVWLGCLARRPDVGGEVMGRCEEIWPPAAYRRRAAIRVQEQRLVPTPSPDDQDHRRADRAAR